jgi:hypothetical protein
MPQPTFPFDPEDFTFDPVEQVFTFSNHHIAIAADTTIVPQPSQLPEVTVDSVTLTFENPSPHDTFTLPVHDFVVPPPVVDHVFDLLGL